MNNQYLVSLFADMFQNDLIKVFFGHIKSRWWAKKL